MLKLVVGVLAGLIVFEPELAIARMDPSKFREMELDAEGFKDHLATLKACKRDDVRLKWLDAQNQRMRTCRASEGQMDDVEAIYKKGKPQSCDKAEAFAGEVQRTTAAQQSQTAIDPRCIY